MPKICILLLTLFLSKAAPAAKDRLKLNEVKIKILQMCEIYNAERYILRCNLDLAGEYLYLGFHANENFYQNVINNNRKKTVQKIGDDYFVQFMIGNHPFNLLSLQKCNIAIAGNDASLLFSARTEIKIENEICR